MDRAQDLIERLCTAAGMIMEDVSAIAIVRDATPSRDDRLAAIEQAGRDIMALAAAASVLARR